MIRTPSDEEAVRLGARYDQERADRVIEFFARFLRHYQGEWAGKPFELLDWQVQRIINPLYGWYWADHKTEPRLIGARRFRKASIWIPKKNGKTTIAAGLTLYHLIADGEPAAQCYGFANDRKQAALVYQAAREMVRKSPALANRLAMNETQKRIFRTDGDPSFYEASSAEADTKEGINPSLVVQDELHAAPNRRLTDALRYATISRRQPLHLVISTAGEWGPESVGYEEYSHAKKVQNGDVVDPVTLGVVYEVPDGADWRLEENWRKANPSIDVTITIEVLRQEFKKAQDNPRQLLAFRRYILNQWVSLEAAWLQMDCWDQPGGPYEVEFPEGAVCYGGLDLSSTTDLTAYVLVCPVEDRYLVKCWVWCPGDDLGLRARSEDASYLQWAEDGHIERTPGRRIDYVRIIEVVEESLETHNVASCTYDPQYAATVAAKLEQKVPMIPMPNTARNLTEPAKRVEKAVVEQCVDHGNNPVLRWAAGNVRAGSAGGELLRLHKATQTARIDPAIALIMAFSRAILGGGETGSIYDDDEKRPDGVIVIEFDDDDY